MSVNSTQLDPLDYLRLEIVYDHLAPLFIINNIQTLRVSKLWQSVLSDIGLWKQLTQNCKYLKKEHTDLALTDPKKSYFLNQKIRSNIAQGKYDTLFSSIYSNVIIKKIEAYGDSFLEMRYDSLLEFNLNRYKFCPTSPITKSFIDVYHQIEAFTSIGQSVIFLTRKFELYKQDFNGFRVKLHDNVAVLDDGTHTHADLPEFHNSYQIYILNKKYVCGSGSTDFIHVVDEYGNKISKYIEGLSALCIWQDYIVIGTMMCEIALYDEKLNFVKTLKEQELYRFEVKESCISSLLPFDDYLVSAGVNQCITKWSLDGTCAHISDETTVCKLGILDNQIVSLGKTINIWNKNKTSTLIKYPKAPPVYYMDMIVFEDKIIAVADEFQIHTHSFENATGAIIDTKSG
ncbi:MAG: hypothetical protein JHC93_07800 [Parachlamydiales bacterium]|nr:hypothetical protein [Parachlamydiales bacterium]